MKELSSDHSQDLQSPLLKSNSLSNIDLVARNLLLLAYDPMENSDCAEEKITREDDNLKKDGEFILPPNEKGEKDEDEQPLIWKVKKLKDNKGKEKLIGSDITGDEIDVTHTAKEDETCKIAGMSSQKSPLPHPENSETKSTSILCYKRNIHKVTEEGGKKTQNRSEGRENNLASHISTNGTSGDTKNIGSSSNQSFLEPKSKYSELKLNKAIPVVPFQARASSRFIFDMPFLQAQLNQMNPAGKNDIPLVSRDNMERSLYSQEVIIRWTGK
ncbi:hypothetical protein FXO37_06686 [Capsicum annuum]|nr:hypothetical protein FXO37_06686 [Capsicum annuum]